MDYKIALPSKPRVVSEEGHKGVYEIDGLYAGYGYTLGNSLRRIILSSIPGAAITAVKIEGVPHEFSKITGVKEDVITILLNLKKIRFKMHTDEPQTATLAVHGIKNVTAKDISVSSSFEVLNKDEFIATLTSKVEVGNIILDAIFTPIRRVNYEVENMRVGDRTDYNRLRFFIETDGSISPAEALEKSIEIMINHLKEIIGFQEPLTEETKTPVVAQAEKEEEIEDTETLKIRIEDLQFSSRTLNALSSAGIRTLGGLIRKKEEDLFTMKGVGKKAVQEIRRTLGNYGLMFK
ncbi:MAG: DNA-directed RNA polymerase subunit alpha [Candidatus Parcubacteria bacterium]|nr:DNA-directed RNA polymerase subunit alpha [Candidatus Parcubacteria bacterium]